MDDTMEETAYKRLEFSAPKDDLQVLTMYSMTLASMDVPISLRNFVKELFVDHSAQPPPLPTSTTTDTTSPPPLIMTTYPGMEGDKKLLDSITQLDNLKAHFVERQKLCAEMLRLRDVRLAASRRLWQGHKVRTVQRFATIKTKMTAMESELTRSKAECERLTRDNAELVMQVRYMKETQEEAQKMEELFGKSRAKIGRLNSADKMKLVQAFRAEKEREKIQEQLNQVKRIATRCKELILGIRCLHTEVRFMISQSLPGFVFPEKSDILKKFDALKAKIGIGAQNPAGGNNNNNARGAKRADATPRRSVVDANVNFGGNTSKTPRKSVSPRVDGGGGNLPGGMGGGGMTIPKSGMNRGTASNNNNNNANKGKNSLSGGVGQPSTTSRNRRGDVPQNALTSVSSEEYVVAVELPADDINVSFSYNVEQREQIKNEVKSQVRHRSQTFQSAPGDESPRFKSTAGTNNSLGVGGSTSPPEPLVSVMPRKKSPKLVSVVEDLVDMDPIRLEKDSPTRMNSVKIIKEPSDSANNSMTMPPLQRQSTASPNTLLEEAQKRSNSRTSISIPLLPNLPTAAGSPTAPNLGGPEFVSPRSTPSEGKIQDGGSDSAQTSPKLVSLDSVGSLSAFRRDSGGVVCNPKDSIGSAKVQPDPRLRTADSFHSQASSGGSKGVDIEGVDLAASVKDAPSIGSWHFPPTTETTNTNTINPSQTSELQQSPSVDNALLPPSSLNDSFSYIQVLNTMVEGHLSREVGGGRNSIGSETGSLQHDGTNIEIMPAMTAQEFLKTTMPQIDATYIKNTLATLAQQQQQQQRQAMITFRNQGTDTDSLVVLHTHVMTAHGSWLPTPHLRVGVAVQTIAVVDREPKVEHHNNNNSNNAL
eukprot:PhF_6_TR27171/c0_g1_i3/m.39807